MIFQLFEVGHLCGLMPDETPTDEQLHLACELSGGVGKNDEGLQMLKSLKTLMSHTVIYTSNTCWLQNIQGSCCKKC